MTHPIVADRFNGQTAIITGAGSGIGRATALRMAAEGAHIVAADISADRLAALAAEIPGLTIVSGDLAAPETIDKIAAAAKGRADVLVNNAGIMDGFLPAGEVDDETWDRVFAVNLTSVMRLTRAVLPLMLKAGQGAIVNVASEAGLRGSCAGAAYTASKHAVIGYTKNTAFMYATKGIRVNAVAPGAVRTNIEAPMKSALAGERLGPILQTIVPGMGEAEQLAAAIAWLASADSANITGVILPSDGGWSAI